MRMTSGCPKLSAGGWGCAHERRTSDAKPHTYWARMEERRPSEGCDTGGGSRET